MSFIDVLDRVREKPEHVRFRIALVTALSITAVIVVMWLLALSVRSYGEAGAAAAGTPAAAENTGLFTNLIRDVKHIVDTGTEGIKNTFGEMGKVQYEAE